MTSDLATQAAERAERMLDIEEIATKAGWEADISTEFIAEEKAAYAAWDLARDVLALVAALQTAEDRAKGAEHTEPGLNGAASEWTTNHELS